MSLVYEILLHQPDKIEEICLGSNASKTPSYDRLLELIEEKGVSWQINDNMMKSLSVKDNTYALAVFRRYSSRLANDKVHLILDLDDYEDLGTIIRSAIAFDFKDIAILNKDIDIFDPVIVRNSAGAIFSANIEQFDTLDEYLARYKRKVERISSKGRDNYETHKLNKDQSILFDNSSEGLRIKAARDLDDALYIGACLYELMHYVL